MRGGTRGCIYVMEPMALAILRAAFPRDPASEVVTAIAVALFGPDKEGPMAIAAYRALPLWRELYGKD